MQWHYPQVQFKQFVALRSHRKAARRDES
uniref:Uncharacterized protein n=1 Tax=Anguilla anguilla TaxID=7936 RepID=A0A0E9S4A2_ANGAN